MNKDYYTEAAMRKL